ncbi:MAG: DUF2892 domain-containing protein [Gammaproteobacteria bacterium]|nr:DUF2892 domain-containing protein [Gammaproteobacteria bacterium]
MTINNAVNFMAGSMIILGLGLAHFNHAIDITSPSWLWLSAFVGLNLMQMAITGFCPAKFIFKLLGLKDSKG